MAYAIHCMNNISDKGIALLSSDYKLTDDLSQADGILVRSASLHDVEFPEGLRAIARAGAGVNNIRSTGAPRPASSCSTRPAPTPMRSRSS